MEEGSRIVYLDEAVFTFNTFAQRTWYPRYHNLELPEKKYSHKAQALIAAVSVDRGVDHFRVHPRSVRTNEFVSFIEDLAAKQGGHKLAVFMDNMRVHRSKIAMETMSKLGIEAVYNVPYSPQFNGIEAVFSMAKACYKRM
jgi:DDE superfamily endonuclease